MSLDFEWWHICIIAFLIFLAFLFTNYVLKKINEVRIEERLVRLLQKTPTHQSTQIHETVMNIRPTTNNAENAVSLVFDKDDNILQDHRKSRDIYPIRSKNRELEDIKEITEKPDDILSDTRQVSDKGSTTVTETIVAQSSENNKNVLASLVIKDSDYNSYASNSISLISQKTAETQSIKISDKLKPKATDSNYLNQAVQLSTTPRNTDTSNKQIETKRIDITNAGTLTVVSGIQLKTDDESSFKVRNSKTNRQEVKETDAANFNFQVPGIMQKKEERLPYKMGNFDDSVQETKTVAINPNVKLPDVMKKTEKVISFKLRNSESNSQESKETATFNPEIPASVVLEKTNSSKTKISEKSNSKIQIPDVLKKIKQKLPCEINKFEEDRQDIKEAGATCLNNELPVEMQETEEILTFNTSNFEKNRLEVKETSATNFNIQRPDILEKTENGLPSKISSFENSRHEIKAPDVTNVNIQAPGLVQETEGGIPFKISNSESNSQKLKDTVALNPEDSASIILEKLNCSIVDIAEKSEITSHKSILMKNNLSSDKENTEIVNQNVEVPEMSQIKSENSSEKINVPEANDTGTLSSEVDAP